MSARKVPVWGLMIINVVFILVGLGICGGGIWAYLAGQSFGVTTTVAIGVICTGLGVFLVAFLGFLGTYRLSKALLWTYFVVLLLLFGAQIAIGVVAYLDRAAITSGLSHGWNQTNAETTRKDFQNRFDCCGFYYPADRPALCGDDHTPCCPTGINVTSTDTKDGCDNSTKDLSNQYLTYVVVAAFVMAGIQIVGMVFAVCLVFVARGENGDLEMRDYK